MIWVLASLVVVVVLWGVALRWGADSMLRRQAHGRRATLDWEDCGPTPLGDQRYTPQGLTWVAGRLIFANSWKDTRSRVYEFDPDTMRVMRTFDMPSEAVHTSGLAWDGTHLWAVDYKSNRAYCLDLERSFADGRPSVVGLFDTTLRGTSACCFVPWNGRMCLAISDFMRTRRTLLVRHDEALAAGTAAGCVEFTYWNEGLSQGLEFFDGHLFESENKWGVNVINQISLEKLRETASSHRSTVRQFAAPSRGVEDLAWDGQNLWTSDETVFRFFRVRWRENDSSNSAPGSASA